MRTDFLIEHLQDEKKYGIPDLLLIFVPTLLSNQKKHIYIELKQLCWYTLIIIKAKEGNTISYECTTDYKWLNATFAQ